MSSNFATPDSIVKVTGTLTNHTGSAIQGLVVQLLTSSQYFGYRAEMDGYANGSITMFVQPAGTPDTLPGTLASGATVRWTASFSPAQAAYGVFGVYPLEVQATSSVSAAVATSKTFLPFWPGSGSGRPQPLDAAWIWPLIDQPQQGACPQTLATNSLAGSLTSAGRLGTMLATGERWAQQDHLTWAVDPALLSDATVMTHKYAVGGDAVLLGADPRARQHRRDPMAVLAARRDGGRRDVPHAVRRCRRLGADPCRPRRYVADGLPGRGVGGRKILTRPFGKTGAGTGDGGIAWPAGGTADASVLTSLASNGGIKTVVLNSGALPSSEEPYDNALGRTTTGISTTMQVLLADSQLTSILASAPAGSSAGAQFRAEQDFLAETAMILAEAPSRARSIVIAPPRHWDPPATEAAKLLALTARAPWLRKVGLSTLATAAGHLKAREALPGNRVSKAELSESYLDQVSAVSANLGVYKDLLYKPSAGYLQTLNAALAATTSAAWRGDSAAMGQAAWRRPAAQDRSLPLA